MVMDIKIPDLDASEMAYLYTRLMRLGASLSTTTRSDSLVQLVDCFGHDTYKHSMEEL